jgi:hypothetical protein
MQGGRGCGTNCIDVRNASLGSQAARKGIVRTPQKIPQNEVDEVDEGDKWIVTAPHKVNNVVHH